MNAPQHGPDVRPLTGDEPIEGTSVNVRDFWRFALSDLASSTNRSRLAEFLVATALGVAHRPRVEWLPNDLVSPTGTRVEVKSTGDVQSWTRRHLRFVRPRRSRTWLLRPTTPVPGHRTVPHQAGPTFQTDVYIFAVHSSDNEESYNPLKISEWAFYVVPASIIGTMFAKTRNKTKPPKTVTISVSWVDQYGALVPFDELAEAVEEARTYRADTPWGWHRRWDHSLSMTNLLDSHSNRHVGCRHEGTAFFYPPPGGP